MQKQAEEQIKEHPITKLKISELVFDPSNPNVMTPKQMHGLRASMQKFGYLTPVVIDQNNRVADGEHRALVYREFGYTEIPVIKMHLETDADRRQLRQVLNKLHGTHDKEKDSDELLQIYESEKLDELAILIAQPKDQLLQILQQYHKEYDFLNNETTTLTDKELSELVPQTQLGDVYLLGNRHRLICADSTDIRSIVGKLLKPDGHSSVHPDLVFTDPPYNVGFKYNEHKDTMNTAEYIDFCKNWYKVLKQAGSSRIIITPGPRNVVFWNEITEGEPPTDIAMWYEGNSRTGASLFHFRRCEPILFYGNFQKDKKRTDDYFDYPMIIPPNLKNTEKSNPKFKKETKAPAKPLKLISELITQYSEPNASVLDLFTGSGTTLIACEQMNRTFYGSELDPHYCDLIVRRYEKYTGKEVVKLT